MALRRALLVAGWHVASARSLKPARLRVMTYNVHAWRDSDHVDNFARIVDVCAAAAPDVLCLNEVLHPYDGAAQDAAYFAAVAAGEGRGRAVADCGAAADAYLGRLADALDMPHVSYVEADCAGSYFGVAPFGNAILSRRPFVASGTVALAAEAGDVDLGPQARDSVEDRALVWAEVDVRGERVTVAAAHLDHKSEPLRAKQLRACLAGLEASGAGASALLCGDFNTFRRRDHDDAAWASILAFYASRGWPEPDEVSAALDVCGAAGYADAAADFGPLAPTCWTHNPLFRIDHVQLSAALRRRCRVADYRRLDSGASDHFPVVVDLDFD